MIWKYKEVLSERGITPYQLQSALHGVVAHTVPYAWNDDEPPGRLDVGVLEKVISAVNELSAGSHEPVGVGDLLEYGA